MAYSRMQLHKFREFFEEKPPGTRVGAALCVVIVLFRMIQKQHARGSDNSCLKECCLTLFNPASPRCI